MDTLKDVSLQLDSNLVMELYGSKPGEPLEHLGTFNLDNDEHLGVIIGDFGYLEVIKIDKYKAYAMVYCSI